MAYLALYRKWRPQSFAEVIGQDSIRQTLQNSLKSGRISHAYLFSGPRGTGKTTIARLLAKGLDCAQGPTDSPCGECSECRAIANGSSLNVIEVDGASNRGIDEIRELREQVRLAPVGAKYKVYIIDEVHMLTTEAFNALLKTLEEPPSHVVFIFATTDLHKVPATILSRCQRYDFKRLAMPELVEGLKNVVAGESVTAEEAALTMIAKHAQGGMRDALSILEQCITYTDTLTVETTADVLGVAPEEEVQRFIEEMLQKDQRACLGRISHLYDSGKDLVQFARDVVDQLRVDVIDEASSQKQLVLLNAIRQLSVCIREMRYAVDLRIPLELSVLELTSDTGSSEPAIESGHINKLMQKLKALEQQIQSLGSGQSARDDKQQETTAIQKRPAGQGDLERSQFIVDNWEEYLHALRSERLVQSAAFLREGRPVHVRGNTATISFPRDRGFHKASIEQTKHREAAQRVLSKFVGTSLLIECVFDDELDDEPTAEQPKPTPAQPQTEPERESSVKTPESQGSTGNAADVDDETVKAALRIFGGKVVRKPE